MISLPFLVLLPFPAHSPLIRIDHFLSLIFLYPSPLPFFPTFFSFYNPFLFGTVYFPPSLPSLCFFIFASQPLSFYFFFSLTFQLGLDTFRPSTPPFYSFPPPPCLCIDHCTSLPSPCSPSVLPPPPPSSPPPSSFSDHASLLISFPLLLFSVFQLGLSVLTKRPRGRVKTSLGGKGVDTQEVVRLLERVTVTAPAKNSKGNEFFSNCSDDISCD